MKRGKSTSLGRYGARASVISEWWRCRGDLDRVTYRTGQRRSQVKKWVQRFVNEHNINDRPRSGRPSRLTAQQGQALSRAVEQGLSVPAAVAQLRKEGAIPKSVSIRTARRAVSKESSFKTANPKPLLTATAKEKRVTFSRRRYKVGNLVAIDSTIVHLFEYQPRRGRWVRKGTRPTQPKPVKSQKLHVYGGISKHGKTELVYVTGTTGMPKLYHKAGGKGLYDGVCAQEFQDVMEQKLYPQAKAIMEAAGESDPVFLMDGAPPHTAKSTINFLQAKGIQFLHGWPPNSPDLNPIENLWAYLKRLVVAEQPVSLEALKAASQHVWGAVPDSMLRKLMKSFSKRRKKCVSCAGEHTGY